MSFKDTAPMLHAAGIKENAVKELIDKKVKPEKPMKKEPEITTEKIEAVLEAVYVVGVGKSGGLPVIAQKNKLLMRQVKQILKEVDAVESANTVVTDE